MSQINFSVLIVTYNNEKCILDLLGDIEDLDADVLSRTLIVDNHSTDETVLNIRSNFPQVRILQNHENLGYGGAVNQGVGEIDGDHFFLLNPDIRLPIGFFPEMINASALKNYGAIAPLQYKLKGSKKVLNFCWSFWKFESFKLFLANKLRLKKVFKSPIPVTYLNAGCLLINKDAFLDVGGFDEGNFLYGEEPDLFLKFKLSGYRSFLHPGVEIIHMRDQSINNLPVGEYVRIKENAIFNIMSELVKGYAGIVSKRIGNWIGRRDYA